MLFTSRAVLDLTGCSYAQYEVLGSSSERGTRPGWDDRRLLTPVKPCVREKEPNVSIVPAGTDISLCIISQHFVLGFYEADVVKPHRKKVCLKCF
jgi:hypothetical protein